MLEIEIQLSRDCYRMGTLRGMEGSEKAVVLGPFSIAGRMRSDAEQHELGVLAGTYAVKSIRPMVGATLNEIRQFGRYGMIALEPTTSIKVLSDSADDESIFIHGGVEGADGSLSSTSDSLRLHNDHVHELTALLSRNENAVIRIVQSIEYPASQTLAKTESATPAGLARKVACALPLGFALIPGLSPSAARAQSASCSYDSGTSFSSVDASTIASLNGGYTSAGYVPSALCGVTVGGGLDLGVFTSQQLLNMGMPQHLVTALAPYLAKSATQPLLGAAASAALKANPLTIGAAAAQALTDVYYVWAANTIASLYNAAVTKLNKIKGTTFSALPMRYQTSMVAMYITNTSFASSTAFTQLASGEWASAIASLRAYGSSSPSVNKLAHLYGDYVNKVSIP